MCRTVHAVLQTLICGIQMLVRVFMTVILMLENVIRMFLQTLYNFISFILQMLSLIPICVVFLLTARLKCFMCGGGGPCPVNRGGTCDCIMSALAFVILFFIFRATGVLDKIFYSLGYAKAAPMAHHRFAPTPGDVTECSRDDFDNTEKVDNTDNPTNPTQLSYYELENIPFDTKPLRDYEFGIDGGRSGNNIANPVINNQVDENFGDIKIDKDNRNDSSNNDINGRKKIENYDGIYDVSDTLTSEQTTDADYSQEVTENMAEKLTRTNNNRNTSVQEPINGSGDIVMVKDAKGFSNQVSKSVKHENLSKRLKIINSIRENKTEKTAKQNKKEKGSGDAKPTINVQKPKKIFTRTKMPSMIRTENKNKTQEDKTRKSSLFLKADQAIKRTKSRERSKFTKSNTVFESENQTDVDDSDLEEEKRQKKAALKKNANEKVIIKASEKLTDFKNKIVKADAASGLITKMTSNKKVKKITKTKMSSTHADED